VPSEDGLGWDGIRPLLTSCGGWRAARPPRRRGRCPARRCPSTRPPTGQTEPPRRMSRRGSG